MAIVMQASGIAGVDMGAASIKMNEDASFNLLVGATDIGTGADTMFCQLAAEALGVPVEKIIPYSSDTDMTPFDPGAYASSTTYISGRAVEKAARAVREQITAVGARMLEEKPEDLVLHGQELSAEEGELGGPAIKPAGTALYAGLPSDASGRRQSPSFRDYTIASAIAVPEIASILVPTHEPTGPFGAKAIAEIPINGPAPAIANAVFHATGARVREIPLTPERVLAALRG